MFALWYGALVYKEYRKDKLPKNISTAPLDNVTLPPTTKIPSPIPKIPPPTTKIPSPSRSPVPTMDLPAKIPPVLATSTPKSTATFDSIPKRSPVAAPQPLPPSPPPPLPSSTINSIEGVEYYEEGEDEDEDEDDLEDENSQLEDENSVISASPWKSNQNK